MLGRIFDAIGRFFDWFFDLKIVTTLLIVIAAVGISAGLWIGANLLFNQVRKSWVTFSTIATAVLGFVFGVVLSGNRILRYSTVASPEDTGFFIRFGYFIWFPILAAVVAGVVAFLVTNTPSPTRIAVGAAGFGGLGVLAGAFVRAEYFPAFGGGTLVGIVVATALFAAIGYGFAMWRGGRPVNTALYGAALGWVIGAWGIPELGTGNAGWTVVAMAVPLALVGTAIGLRPLPSHTERDAIDGRSRGVIFLAPAMLFIFVTLVVPAIRTMILSLQDRKSENWVGLQNYLDVFKDKNSFNLSNWADIFGSRLLWIAVILAVIGIVLGVRGLRQTGHFTELGSPSSFPLLTGFVFFAFALFTAVRGTVINNLWWVVVVVVFSTSLGLAVAVLADDRHGEKIAKSMIFMPMALSMVGASIIWRFMYQARDVSTNQTGVMNAIWVGLGRLSTGNGLPTYIVGGLAVLATIGLIGLTIRAITRSRYGGAAAMGVAALLFTWFTYRFWSPGGVGGVVPVDGGFKSETINFVQGPPFNNVWLMIVMVWIQTGFCMVILSAAIQAVPDELLEAARVDGASPTQVFWRVTLPQIAPTIGVIVTTLIVGVMKVFDIVKVMTNGQFGTQVLANDMFKTAFSDFNTGKGAALAILILISVLPVMIYNIRNMQKES